jgi:hypothetical protein
MRGDHTSPFRPIADELGAKPRQRVGILPLQEADQAFPAASRLAATENFVNMSPGITNVSPLGLDTHGRFPRLLRLQLLL